MSDIIGTAAAERLLGTSGNDTITGNGGGDRIEGGRGDDVLTGGDDAGDTLFGEAGNDTLYGGGGADKLYDGAGDDVLHGGDDADSLYSDGGAGSDTLYGDAGDDFIEVVRATGSSGTVAAYGGAGSDQFYFDVRSGTLTADGGDGDDFFELSTINSPATLTLGAGRDSIWLDSLPGNATGNTGFVVADFQTGPGGDFVYLDYALANYASRWDGISDPFATGFLKLVQSGADTVLQVSTQANGVFLTAVVFKNVSAASFTADNFAGLPLGAAPTAPETVTGTDADDNVSGSSGDDVIAGGGGGDFIWGGHGADTVSGGDGSDYILGGAGNDSIDGGDGNDSIFAGTGNDVIHGGAGNDNLFEEDSGVDELWGDDGNDSLFAEGSPSRAGGGSVTLHGGAGDDSFTVSMGNNNAVIVDGGAGDDRVRIYDLIGTTTASLGDGMDALDLNSWARGATATLVTVTDFATGAGGDRLDWTSFLANNATGYVAGANPFTTGYARLVQSGADVLLQFDRDGAGTASTFSTIAVFQNTNVAAFTAFNLGGFSLDGSVPAPQTLTGSEDADHLYGLGGADTIDGAGGDDIIYGLGAAETLRGGAGADTIHGAGGNDVIEGGDGNDKLYGDDGSDTLVGGAGDDFLSDTSGLSDSLSGGDGNDEIFVQRFSGTPALTVSGGDGNDLLRIYLSVGTVTVDAGAGDDRVAILSSGAATVTLGSGADVIDLNSIFTSTPLHTITITDFQAGDGGDRIDWDEWIGTVLAGYAASGAQDRNPFGTYVRLVQSGADAILQVDDSGAGAFFTNWLIFKNTDVWSLSAYNFDGYATNFTTVHGTAADETFSGGTGNDGFDGGGGNDTFLIGYGGTDHAVGAGGDDTFFVALTSVAASHSVTGAGGNDLLQLQGHGAQAITLGTSAASGNLIAASGIETVQLLASADASRNWGTGAAAAYTLTLQDGVTPAGSTLTIDASGLASVDTLTFSTTESDATLHITGGAGNDKLTGGALGDTLSGGDGNDTLDGGAGSDQLDGGAGNDNFTYLAHAGGPDVDTVTGGAGSDLLTVNFSAMAGPLTWSLTPDGLGGYSGWFQTDADHRVEFSGIELFTITGTNAGETIDGGDGNDAIFGGGGDDVVHGNGGSDLLFGDAGIDTLVGGAGNDTYVLTGAGDSSDSIVENEGEGTDAVDVDFASYTLGANLENLFGTSAAGQILNGNALANFIWGYTGNDTLYGLDGNDILKGDAGNDVLDGGTGADSMDGGAGNDVFYVDDSGDTVTDSSGTDEIRTGLASYTIGASSGVENLTGLASTGQSLTGSSGNNLITGGDGNDVLDGGAGFDTLRGGKGNDTYVVDNSGDLIVENAGEGTDTVRTALTSYTLAAANVENLIGIASTAQTLRGNAGDNVITASGAAATIDFRDGGADSAFGSGGNDTIFFGAAMTSADQVDGGSGSDIVMLQGVYSGLILGANALVNVESLQLLNHFDGRFFLSGVNAVSYNITTVDSNVAAGAQLFVDAANLLSTEALVFNGSAETDGTFKVTGGLAADTITGGGGADTLNGGSGDDLLDGRGGADTMAGGSGNDIYILDTVSDTVTELASAGSDEIRTALASYTLTAANVETLRGTSASGQSLTAGAGGQTIIGGAGNDLLDDGGFAVTLKGGLGDDLYSVHVSFFAIVENGGEGTDTVRSYADSYTLSANLENLVGMLSTGQTLVGNGSANIITGGGGNDRLDGGAGADTMTGGLGNDTYVVDNAGDTITENAGEGTDTVETNLASYTLADTLENLTGTGNTTQALTGNSAANTITGGFGDDILVGGAGNDTLNGYAGFDTASYATGAAIAVTLQSYTIGQVVVGGTETDTLSSIEKIVGSAFADTFTNNSTGGMTFVGGAGDDLYSLAGSNDVIVEAAGGGVDKVVTSAVSYTLAANVENLTGSWSGYQVLRGNGLDNAVVAGSGGALLRLDDGGRDVATGGNGADSIYFGGALDSLDLVEGGAGYDALQLQGSYSGFTLGGNVTGIETLELMSHSDTRFGGATAGSNHYAIASSGFQMSGSSLFVDGTKLEAGETVSFDGSAETAVSFALIGGAGDDTLKGGALGDTLDGRSGNDLMAGGLGNDFYWVRDAGDVVDEAADAGTDSVRTLLATYTLAANVETLIGDLASIRNQTLTGNALVNTITAGDGDDVLDGGGGTSDYLDGGAGNDRLLVHQVGTVSATGGTGNDTLVVDYSASTSAIDGSIQIFTNGQGGSIHDGEGRWTSFSSIETFEITAGSGDDHIVTGSGNDYVDGGAGSDVLEGGAGNDGLYDLAGATTTMRGGDGDDYIFYRRWYDSPWQSATIEAGDGNDKVAFATFLAGAGATIDLGAGDDILYLDEKVGSQLFVTTGTGRDTLQISGLMDGQSASVFVTDFQTGAGGDSIDWATAFPFAFGAHGYQQGSNPFAQGYAQLVQVGNDTLLQISRNADGNFQTILTFQNTSASAFTADNLGWPPAATQAAGANPAGTSGDDWLTGSNAGTFFHLEQGGNDIVTAGAGNDAFYFGAALSAADRIDGGAGADQLALQGDYSAGLTLGAGQLKNIETLVVLPHDDLRFGGGGANPYSYDLTLTDDAVAAGQQLKVNASTLKAGENFTFDGHAETNGSFFLYGGKGVDIFTGGSGADVFFFVEDGRYAPTDHVDGGGGADAMVLRGDYNLTLSADSLVNVETVVFLSGTDARFYASGTDFHYSIATADNTVGAGVTMTFNGGALRGSETLSFDGSAETDGHMRIFGGAANDHIIGGGQSDLIYGGDGADILTGGGGNDEFRFQNISESILAAQDRITDFTTGDVINLGRIDAIAGGGDDAFHLVDAFGGHAGELVLAQGAGNAWTVSGDVNGDGQADFQILVTVADGHLLGASDFVL
jgi:Ca2+-binding RTX toxin-like protein